MMVMVTGDAAFARFAAACEKAAGPSFGEHMDHALTKAGDDLGQAVVTASPIYMPSGYEGIFQTRVRAKSELIRPPSRGVTVIVYAGGRVGRRDVRRLEDGVLRHPVRGRFRALKAGGRYAKKPENIRGGVYINPWSVTRIRGGFFSKPVHYAAPRAFQRLDVAVGDVLEEVGKAS